MLNSLVSLLFLLFCALIALAAYLIPQYNRLQGMAQGVMAAHSNIMVSMKKRVDLINKLIETVSAYADHESLTYIALAKTATSSEEIRAAAEQATGAVRVISQLAMRFPELRANQAYQTLMQQLMVVEADLQEKRESYNQDVRVYNTHLTQFPTILYASRLGFQAAPYFDVENADALENFKEFKTDDGEMLRSLLTDAGRKVAQTSATLGRAVVDKSRDLSRATQTERRRMDTQPISEPDSTVEPTDLSPH